MNILEAWSHSNTTHHSLLPDHPWAVGMGLGVGKWEVEVAAGRGELFSGRSGRKSVSTVPAPTTSPSLEAHPVFLETLAR